MPSYLIINVKSKNKLQDFLEKCTHKDEVIVRHCFVSDPPGTINLVDKFTFARVKFIETGFDFQNLQGFETIDLSLP